jgi:hypothetical protein
VTSTADGQRPMTASDVANLLGMHVHSVKRIPAAELPYFTVGSRKDRRYSRTDVAAYMAARRVDA